MREPILPKPPPLNETDCPARSRCPTGEMSAQVEPWVRSAPSEDLPTLDIVAHHKLRGKPGRDQAVDQIRAHPATVTPSIDQGVQRHKTEGPRRPQCTIPHSQLLFPPRRGLFRPPRRALASLRSRISTSAQEQLAMCRQSLLEVPQRPSMTRSYKATVFSAVRRQE